MDEETDGIPQNRAAARDLDAIDRRILGVLVDDATISYAELGDRVGLSPPAAHERVKRLRRSGAIRNTAAIIDPKSVHKPLLAFVHIDTKGWGKTPELMAVSEHPEVERSTRSPATPACCLKSAPRIRGRSKGCCHASTKRPASPRRAAMWFCRPISSGRCSPASPRSGQRPGTWQSHSIRLVS